MSLTLLSTPQFSFGFYHLWLEVLLVAFVFLVSVVAGAGVNPANQRWGFWPLLLISS